MSLLMIASQARGFELRGNRGSRVNILIDGENVLGPTGFTIALLPGIKANYFDGRREREKNIIRIVGKLGEPVPMAANYVEQNQRIEVAEDGLKSDFELTVRGETPLRKLRWEGEVPAGGNAGKGVWFAVYPDKSDFEWDVFPPEGASFRAREGKLPVSLGFFTGSGKGVKMSFQGTCWKSLHILDARKWADAFIVRALVADSSLPDGTAITGSYAIDRLELEELRDVTDQYAQIAERIDAAPQDEEPAAPFQHIDISAACNMAFKDEVDGDKKGGFTDQGDVDLRELPTGAVEFKGVGFRIIEPADNQGRSCVVLCGTHRPYFPKQAEFRLNARGKSLCFLHTAAWCHFNREEVASYDLLYADGTTAKIPLRGGVEITEWSDWEEPDVAHKVWKGKAGILGDVGLNLLVVGNPHPDKTIVKVVFKSHETDAVPALIAMTVSREKLASLEREYVAEYRPDQSRMVAFNLAPLSANLSGTALDFSFLLAKLRLKPTSGAQFLAPVRCVV